MLIEVENTSGGTLNDLDIHDGGSLAVGGQRKDPLPHPFGHIGPLLDTDTLTLPMHLSDWRYQRAPAGLTHEPKDEWNTLVKAGKVALTTTKEATGGTDHVAGTLDNEDIFENVA